VCRSLYWALVLTFHHSSCLILCHTCLTLKLGHYHKMPTRQVALAVLALQSVSFTSKMAQFICTAHATIHAQGLANPQRHRQLQLLPHLNPHLPHKAFPPQHLPIVLLSLPPPLPHPRSPLFLSLTPLPLPSLILIATFPSSNTFPNRPDLLAAHFSLKPSGQSPGLPMISQPGRIFCSLVAPFCSSPRGVVKSTI
jgi:hypothetical protein